MKPPTAYSLMHEILDYILETEDEDLTFDEREIGLWEIISQYDVEEK